MLALDTSTPAVTAAVVDLLEVSQALAALARRSGGEDRGGERGDGTEAADGSEAGGGTNAACGSEEAGLPPGPVRLLAERLVLDQFGHAEHLLPLASDALAAAGRRLADLDAVVVGIGPGPFTGLRVGIATAVALGDALDRPVHGVPSHDGMASARPSDPAPAGEFLVVTDARRREVYLSGYSAAGRRLLGPLVAIPAEVPALLAAHGRAPVEVRGAGSPLLADLDLPAGPPAGSVGAGLVVRAAPALLTGVVPGPLTPLYLRRPDAVEPGPRKSVLG